MNHSDPVLVGHADDASLIPIMAVVAHFITRIGTRDYDDPISYSLSKSYRPVTVDDWTIMTTRAQFHQPRPPEVAFNVNFVMYHDEWHEYDVCLIHPTLGCVTLTVVQHDYHGCYPVVIRQSRAYTDALVQALELWIAKVRLLHG
jgi:hypothetical protein